MKKRPGKTSKKVEKSRGVKSKLYNQINTYRDIPHSEVEAYASEKGLNITDSEENFREAAILLFAEKYANKKKEGGSTRKTADWKVRVYDKNNKVINSFVIKDRIESEAFREAASEIGNEGDDWTMTEILGKKKEEGGDVSTATEIRNQIGHKALYMLGAYDIFADKGALGFKIRGSRKWKHIKIRLNGKDLYDITFSTWRKNRATHEDELTQETIKDVPVENLHSIIREETGLYTNLQEGGITSKAKEAKHQLRYATASAETAKDYVKDMEGPEEFKEKAKKEIGEATEHISEAMYELNFKEGGRIIKQISTHKAVLEGDKINIYEKGLPKSIAEGDDLKEHPHWFKDKFVRSVPKENRDDLFDIFERYEENNRINRAEANEALGSGLMASGGNINDVYYLVVDQDERGEYRASVCDSNDKLVFDFFTENVRELQEDGFLRWKPHEDLERVSKYLKKRVVSEDEYNKLKDKNEMKEGGKTSKKRIKRYYENPSAEIKYKGKIITKLFPSGYYEVHSDKEDRFLKFDDLDDAKSLIDSESASMKDGGKTSKMKKEHREILDLLEEYLESAPHQRFGQALYNLNINQHVNNKEPWKADFRIVDIYNDSDKQILERLKLAVENDKKTFKN